MPGGGEVMVVVFSCSASFNIISFRPEKASLPEGTTAHMVAGRRRLAGEDAEKEEEEKKNERVRRKRSKEYKKN